MTPLQKLLNLRPGQTLFGKVIPFGWVQPKEVAP